MCCVQELILSIASSFNRKTFVKRPLSKRPKIVNQDQLSLNAGQKYCRMLQWEHSAIFSTFIKLPFVIKIFVLSIFEWSLIFIYNGMTDWPINNHKHRRYNLWARHLQVIAKSCEQHTYLLKTMKYFRPEFCANTTLLSQVLCCKHFISMYE